MRWFWLLLLFPLVAHGVPPVGGTGWTCANYTSNADLDGDSLTIDAGSNRILMLTFIAAFIDMSTELTVADVGGEAPTANDIFATGQEGSDIQAVVFNETAIAAMSGSAINLSGTNGDDFRFCYATLLDAQQAGLSSFAFISEDQTTSAASLDVTTTSTSSEYLCVLGYHDESAIGWTSWDTLTEIDDSSTNNGGRAGLACGDGGDDTTTITPATTTDIAGASMAFDDAGTDTAVLRRRRL